MNIKKMKNIVIKGYFLILIFGFLFALFLLKYTQESAAGDVCYSPCARPTLLNPFRIGGLCNASCSPLPVMTIVYLYVDSVLILTVIALSIFALLKLLERKKKN